MCMLYIDPGAGSLLFQAILSAFFTLVVFYKKIILFLKLKFNKKYHEDKGTED